LFAIAPALPALFETPATALAEPFPDALLHPPSARAKLCDPRCCITWPSRVADTSSLTPPACRHCAVFAVFADVAAALFATAAPAPVPAPTFARDDAAFVN
jgi:hypothetical protein